MKAMLPLFIFFLILFYTDVMGSSAQVDSVLFQEREYYMRQYHSVRDTMTVNSWINLKRLSDNLEKLTATDAQIIDSLVSRIQADSVAIAELTSVNDHTGMEEPMQSIASPDTGNNRMMLLLLKAFVAFLLLVLLFLVYFLIRRSNRINTLQEEVMRIEALASEKQSQAALAELEMNKLKQRELGFREELERGIHLNQERMQSMQQKCELLEEENRMLSSRLKSQTVPLQVVAADDILSAEDEEGKNLIIKSLVEERSSLMNLAATLRAQLADETRKRQSVIEKFRSLYNDMEGGISG